MLLNEQLLNTEWKGHQWVTVRSHPFELKVAIAIGKIPEVQLFDALIPQAIAIITEELPLSEHSRKVKVALFPGGSYRNDLGLEEGVPNWVKVCRRDGVTCYDVSIAHKWSEDVNSIPADDRRELIHELVHELHPFLSSDFLWTPLTIREGGAEVIARLLAKTQQELTSSSKFITSDLENQLIDPLVLDAEGLFARSKNTLSFNPGYLSATVYVAGISIRLGGGNIKLGIQHIKVLAEKYKDENRFLDQLANRVDGLTENKEGRRSLQLIGINSITKPAIVGLPI